MSPERKFGTSVKKAASEINTSFVATEEEPKTRWDMIRYSLRLLGQVINHTDLAKRSGIERLRAREMAPRVDAVRRRLEDWRRKIAVVSFCCQRAANHQGHTGEWP
jgi:hypothetical protein